MALRVHAQGWNRNAGDTTFADFDLTARKFHESQHPYVDWRNPGVYSLNGNVSVAWVKGMRFSGDYRIQIDFTAEEIAAMFRGAFGSEVTSEVLEKCGLTLSPNLKRTALAN